MSPPRYCRLSLIFAREAPIAVVLRRGPTQWVELICWNTADDSFQLGQWLHGRVYPERCGLSPSGKLFVYFAMKYGRPDFKGGYERTFTAVSKPPYWTALAMWPEGSTWGGGGRFIDDQTLRLAYGANGTNHPGVGTTTIFMAPLPPPHPDHLPHGMRIETDLDYYSPDDGFRALSISRDGTWRGQDHARRNIVARDGALFYVDSTGSEVLLRDFNADTFHEVVAPEWAHSW